MSAARGILSLQEEDLTKILVANAHLGSQNLDFQMEQYVFKRKNNGNELLFEFSMKFYYYHIVYLFKKVCAFLTSEKCGISWSWPQELLLLLKIQLMSVLSQLDKSDSVLS